MGHMGGLKKTRPEADNTEPVFQIPVGLPSLERGRHVKKNLMENQSQYWLISVIGKTILDVHFGRPHSIPNAGQSLERPHSIMNAGC